MLSRSVNVQHTACGHVIDIKRYQRTWCVNWIDCGDYETGFDGAQRDHRELGNVGQQDGQNLALGGASLF